MDYQERFTDRDLEKIVDEGLIYMCACPAQVADAIRKLRGLYRYQYHCINDPDNQSEVHQTIAQSAIHAHAHLQDCLDQILTLEKWDRTTLTMPANLRVRQAKAMLSE
ncbi:hypothetical protein [Rhodoferax fermentans]|uniref:Uncharacterized protein n=1 Tax=Rhodoferax fermentans TaxID=28066 RepID=A0A1T1ARC3_RHOFE|nr:hypothetical protein [Rhodoferax fermentans]MBK1684704.1 hypothetical protein [Rhodoferax fermentans]OOV06553.1 hypothetical protein RF819_07225 [Rhodoferax fermentans]